MKVPTNHSLYTAANDLKMICKPLQKIGIHHFAFTRSFNNGKRIYLSTTPIWQEFYFQHDFHLRGTCEQKPITYSSQSMIWSTLPNQKFYLGLKQFGLQEGLFIVRKHEKYTDFFDFVSGQSHSAVNNFLTHTEIINCFTAYFLDKAAEIIKNASKMPLILPFAQGVGDFVTKKESLFLKDKYKVVLSKQQNKCAQRLLLGHTDKKIALDLSLSPRTVETYINNLKAKFGVESRYELLKKLSQICYQADQTFLDFLKG